MKAAAKSLRARMAKRLRWHSELPLIVYVVVFCALIALWSLRRLNEDLTLNLFSELLGAAFTLFIIDTLLVRSRTKRWHVVRAHIDYLIARHVHRLRDGLSTRMFGFRPTVRAGVSHEENLAAGRQQRASLLEELAALPAGQLEERINKAEAFAESSYEYFNEKADDIWDLLNMKYSEYLAPELVSLLIELHTHLKDACGHIRQYRKKERFVDDAAHYRAVGISGLANTLSRILMIVNRLKKEGYSDPARPAGHGTQ